MLKLYCDGMFHRVIVQRDKRILKLDLRKKINQCKRTFNLLKELLCLSYQKQYTNLILKEPPHEKSTLFLFYSRQHA